MKIYKWLSLILFLICIGLSITILIQAGKINGLEFKRMYSEGDIDQISNALRGKVMYSDFCKIVDRFDDYQVGDDLGLGMLKMTFDPMGMLDSITYEW